MRATLVAVTSHRITYEGPSSLAVRAATLLADAEGVELTTAGQPAHGEGLGDPVRLTMTVEATTEAVRAAVRMVGDGLPANAQITINEDTAPN